MGEIEFDPVKRRLTLEHRGSTWRAGEVFEGPTFTIPNNRRDYGELHAITAGFLDGRMVVLVWTSRGEARRNEESQCPGDRELPRKAGSTLTTRPTCRHPSGPRGLRLPPLSVAGHGSTIP